MKDRAAEIAGFLTSIGWDDADEMPLRADFSPRRFARLEKDGKKRAILMDADADQHTVAFVELAALLRALGVSAPEIYAENAEAGLVLMEDFGNRCFGKVLDSGENPLPLYRRATDVLIHVHKHFDKKEVSRLDVPIYGGALFAAQAELFLDAYIPFAEGREANHEESEGFRAAWKGALKGIETLPETLLLRDFMPDNLMDLPGRDAHLSVGLLDFQDAGIGPAPYDLASLCEMVRRDAGEGMLEEMIDYYHERLPKPLTKNDLRRTCRVLAAQRHTRILGIVARWIVKTGGSNKSDKYTYIRRIWGWLDQLLVDDALKPVRLWMERHAAPRQQDFGT
jgi:aminoglycoside/choline kinase family phosphotransferase